MFVETKHDGEAPAILEPWREVLLYAANLIEHCGWCQRQFTDGQNRVCALWAIRSYRGDGRVIAQYKMHDFVGGDIPTWNDRKGRTQDQVVFALRACAGQ